MNHKLLGVIFLLGLVSFLPAHQPALACSGGGEDVTSLNTIVASAEVVVEATIIETDDAGKNLILQVSQYLKGSGSEYLLLYRTDPALSATYDGHHYDTDCLYGGATPLYTEMRGYFALTRQSNGAYSYSAGGWMLEYMLLEGSFPTTFHTKIDPAGPDDPTNWADTNFTTEQEFVTWVLNFADSTLTSPDSFIKPRLTPLLITTVTGSQYLLPIDGGAVTQLDTPQTVNEYSAYAYPNMLQAPPVCTESDCVAYTPDRSLKAWFSGVPDTILVDYYPYYGEVLRDGNQAQPVMPFALVGQAFAFSSTGEVLMIWDHGTLHLFWVNNQPCACAYGEFVPRLDELITLPLVGGEQVLVGAVRWSADGTTMAFADGAGIWVLDIFRMSAPELLKDAKVMGDMGVAFVSTTGRYVAYQQNSNYWYTIDRLSGMEYSKAIPSPNERMLAQFDVLESSTPPTACTLPLNQCTPLEFSIDARPQFFVWMDNTRYFAVICADNGVCDLTSGQVNLLEYTSAATSQSLPVTSAVIRDVAYVPNGNWVAAAVNSRDVLLWSEFDRWELIELGDFLDGEIVDIAWLPSLFYREN